MASMFSIAYIKHPQVTYPVLGIEAVLLEAMLIEPKVF